jgi:hypothetical protein
MNRTDETDVTDTEGSRQKAAKAIKGYQIRVSAKRLGKNIEKM